MRTYDKYWNMNRTRSHNAIFNFIDGARGTGKTYDSLCTAIEKWLQTRRTDAPWQWLYIRRYHRELDNLTHMAHGGSGKIFDDVRKEFKGHKLEAKEDILLCDDEEMGGAFSLTKVAGLKSFPYPFVHFIIFEEFITANTRNGYLKNEVATMLDFHTTVDRYQDRVTWWFLGNHVNEANPYYTYFNIELPAPGKIRKYGDRGQILVENVVKAQLKQEVQESRLGSLLKDTQFGKYAFENKALDMNVNFIRKKTGTCNYSFGLLYYERKIGVWWDYRNGCYYISDDFVDECHVQYAATTNDQQPNVMLFKGSRSPFLKKLVEAYKMGRVFYESKALKACFTDIMRLVYV